MYHTRRYIFLYYILYIFLYFSGALLQIHRFQKQCSIIALSQISETVHHTRGFQEHCSILVDLKISAAYPQISETVHVQHTHEFRNSAVSSQILKAVQYTSRFQKQCIIIVDFSNSATFSEILRPVQHTHGFQEQCSISADFRNSAAYSGILEAVQQTHRFQKQCSILGDFRGSTAYPQISETVQHFVILFSICTERFHCTPRKFFSSSLHLGIFSSIYTVYIQYMYLGAQTW